MACFNDRSVSPMTRPPGTRRGPGTGLWSFLPARLFGLPIFAALLLASCSSNPTPYQPIGEEGGYEESRLQKRIYRVSFKGNRHTREADVLDFLFLRSAELTVKNGFTHFIVQKDFGRTQMDLQAESSGPRFGFGLGFGRSSRRSFWGLGFGTSSPSHYSATISYHLAMFVIKMLNAEEAAPLGDKAFHASFMIESLSAKKERSLRKGS